MITIDTNKAFGCLCSIATKNICGSHVVLKKAAIAGVL